MTFKDESYEKLVKQARKKRTGKTIMIAIGTFIVLFGLFGGGYLWYKNQMPFLNQEKVAGVPNNHIKQLQNETWVLGLSFDAYGGFAYNTDAKKMTLYVDYYEKDRREKHDMVMEIERVGKKFMSGQFYWGVTNKKDLDTLDELKVRINDEKNNPNYASNYDFEPLKFKDISGINSLSENSKIKKNQPYLLMLRTTETTAKSYSDVKTYFKKDYLKENKQTVIVYLVFE